MNKQQQKALSKSYILVWSLVTGGFLSLSSTMMIHFVKESIIELGVIFILFIGSVILGIRITGAIKPVSSIIQISICLITITFFLYLLPFIDKVIPYTNYLKGFIHSCNIIGGIFCGFLLVYPTTSITDRRYFKQYQVFWAIIGILTSVILYVYFFNKDLNFGYLSISIALFFLIIYFFRIRHKKRLSYFFLIEGLIIIFSPLFMSNPVVFLAKQKKYQDKVVFHKAIDKNSLTVTQWKNDYWIYINDQLSFSSIDECMYYETLVHPALGLSKNHEKVLILGGENGCVVREVLKYENIDTVTLIPEKPFLIEFFTKNEILKNINNHALSNTKTSVRNVEIFKFLEKHSEKFDVIIADLPDPVSQNESVYYSIEFYNLCYSALKRDGIFVTQTGNSYLASMAYQIIDKSMKYAGFETVPLHNQILTMGEWGFIIGSKRKNANQIMKSQLRALTLEQIDTRWINRDAMYLITSFGKNLNANDSLKINSLHKLNLHKQYQKGDWP